MFGYRVPEYIQSLLKDRENEPGTEDIAATDEHCQSSGVIG